MRITRIYTEQSLALNTTIALTEQAKHHVAVVLRMKAQDSITLFNGDGVDYVGTITLINKKSVEIKLTTAHENTNESGLQIHLGQCLSQGQRFDLAIQKASELGVSEITPIISERSQKLASKQFEKKQKHWQQIAINAAEQSHRAKVPVIHKPIKLDEWLSTTKADVKWVCAISKKAEACKPSTNVTTLSVLIGPEGGLNDKEEQLAINNFKFTAVNFGRRILRTETAPIAALSLAQHFWGDFTL